MGTSRGMIQSKRDRGNSSKTGGQWEDSSQGEGWRRKQDHQYEKCVDVGPSQALAEGVRKASAHPLERIITTSSL